MNKFVVLMHDGIGPASPMPEPPGDHNTVATLAQARKLFGLWLYATGNDYLRAEGYGQPWADVVLLSSWDGVSYGDVTGGSGVCRFVRGPRGGILREGF